MLTPEPISIAALTAAATPRGRILVFDMDTLKFKRGWGAYGKPLSEIKFDPNAKYDPKGPPAKDFLGHLTITVSRDGFVYAADRIADLGDAFEHAGPQFGNGGGLVNRVDQSFRKHSRFLHRARRERMSWSAYPIRGMFISGHFEK